MQIAGPTWRNAEIFSSASIKRKEKRNYVECFRSFGTIAASASNSTTITANLLKSKNTGLSLTTCIFQKHPTAKSYRKSLSSNKLYHKLFEDTEMQRSCIKCTYLNNLRIHYILYYHLYYIERIWTKCICSDNFYDKSLNQC